MPVETKTQSLIDEETNLTRKIEQRTGKKTKTILAENIQYLEEKITLTELEFEKKKVYFKEENFVLLIFQNNYYKIDDDVYQISVSHKDFDGILEQYSRLFISKLTIMLANKTNLSDEEKELLEQYENMTIRDWTD